jgi:putative N6-adenine-specific DNA methylase
MRFLATVAKGLEDVVEGELGALNLAPAGAPRAGLVPFEGGWEAGYRACLHLRAARRVLMEVGRFEAPGADALYSGVRSLRWADHLSRKTTFAVEASVRDNPSLTHSGYAALKVKDGVADALRAVFGARPDVDRDDPDVRILLHLHGTSATLALDLSGPLHKRGYRVKTVPAPLNETLAAGVLLLAGYDGTAPFADPFCGSGTLCIEAALIASRTAPGLVRKSPFGFERWPDFRDRTFGRVTGEARAEVRRAPSPIRGTDSDGRALIAARDNAAAAGVAEMVRFDRRDARDFVPPGPRCLVVSNPPYGDHAGAGEDLAALYRGFGDALKKNAGGATACLLCGNPALAKCVGLRPSRRVPLWNGPMECRLLEYRMVEGEYRKRPQEPPGPDSGGRHG